MKAGMLRHALRLTGRRSDRSCCCTLQWVMRVAGASLTKDEFAKKNWPPSSPGRGHLWHELLDRPERTSSQTRHALPEIRLYWHGRRGEFCCRDTDQVKERRGRMPHLENFLMPRFLISRRFLSFRPFGAGVRFVSGQCRATYRKWGAQLRKGLPQACRTNARTERFQCPREEGLRNATLASRLDQLF